MQEEALDSAARVLSDSFDPTCEALLYDDDLIEIFGERYSKRPSEFKFLPGQISALKSLAAHVNKLVEVKGVRYFGEHFSNVGRDTLKRIVSQTKSDAKTDHRQLRIELFEKVTRCLESYDVDVANFSDSCIEIDPSGTYGEITCILCSDENQQPKRVYYSEQNARPSFWVLSNFHKHLKLEHSLVQPRNSQQRQKQKQKAIVSRGRKRKALESDRHSSNNDSFVNSRSNELNAQTHDQDFETKDDSSKDARISGIKSKSTDTAEQLLDDSVEIVGNENPAANSLLI